MRPDSRRERYLSQRAVSSPWTIENCSGFGFSGVVVVPALAESTNLPATLASLAHNPEALLGDFLVLVVVNHREDAAPQDKADNLATLQMLAEAAGRWPINLAWVDAASAGRELPLQGGGVGMARKIGFDLALPRLSWGRSPLLVSLDADTLVEPGYLPAVVDHFRRAAVGGAVIQFRHRDAETAAGQEIIDRYELFLRSYVLGLAYAGSPYAFHTVGSAMACTGDAYLRCGGMNCRRAGEDFYFLQQLKKTVGIDQVSGTVVHPSPRPSHRVPFGTGRSVAKALSEGEGAISFYHPECFALLRKWLALASGSFGLSGEAVMREAAGISPLLAGYLEGERFLASWERLSKGKRVREPFLAAFHEWFDGLRTMKLIHHLSAGGFPRCRFDEAVPELLAMAGAERVCDPRVGLELLRRIQNG